MSKPTLHPLIKHARMLANFFPDLPVPSDGFTLVRVQPMRGRLLRHAKEVAIRKECYYNAMKMVLQNSFQSARYVVGYVGKAYPSEHAWVKIGNTYYDPTWELFLSIDDDYLPLFELDLGELCREIHGRDSLYPPDLRDLMRWADRNRAPREKKGAQRKTGAPLMGFIHPPNGDDL